MAEQTRQYVLMQTQREMPISQLLAGYPEVIVLSELDELTALVEMSERVRNAISDEFPELVVEPNLPYSLQGHRSE